MLSSEQVKIISGVKFTKAIASIGASSTGRLLGLPIDQSILVIRVLPVASD